MPPTADATVVNFCFDIEYATVTFSRYFSGSVVTALVLLQAAATLTTSWSRTSPVRSHALTTGHTPRSAACFPEVPAEPLAASPKEALPMLLVLCLQQEAHQAHSWYLRAAEALIAVRVLRVAVGPWDRRPSINVLKH